MRWIHVLIVRVASVLFMLLSSPFLWADRIDFDRGKKRNPFYKSKITALLERHPRAYDLAAFMWNFPQGPRIYRILPDLSGRVLQVGCGTGLLNRYIRAGKKNGAEMINLDINKNALRYARRKRRIPGGVNANVHHIPIKDGMLDAVVFPRCFHHIRFPAKALKECERVLKHRGVVVITDPVCLYLKGKRDSFMVNSEIDGMIWRYNPDAFKKHIRKNLPPNLRLRLFRRTRQINVSNYNMLYPHADSLVVLEKV